MLSAELTKLVTSRKQVFGELFFCSIWSFKFKWHISKGEEGTDEILKSYFIKKSEKCYLHQNHSVLLHYVFLDLCLYKNAESMLCK